MQVKSYSFEQTEAGIEVDKKVRQYMKDRGIKDYSKTMLDVLADDQDLLNRYVSLPEDEEVRTYDNAPKVKTFSEAQASIDDQVQAIIWEKGCDYEAGLRYVLNKPENHFIAKKYLRGDPANVCIEGEED